MTHRNMKADEIYAAGYAIPQYNLMGAYRYWRFRNEDFTLTAGAVPLHNLPDLPVPVAKIEDVRAAAKDKNKVVNPKVEIYERR